MGISLDKRVTAAINHCVHAVKQHIQADVLFPGVFTKSAILK
ncbi:hypothetical protein DDI_0015 [Dickeya dianthicola RNS04.9]|nr:hypothetical protein DDI_0015 [Dickeya dianthicola RNS04.9]